MTDSILSQMSHSLGRKDEEPNIILAHKLVREKDIESIDLVAGILKTGRGPAQKDAIKILYEIGGDAPDLLVPYTEFFLKKMQSNNNRMVWGALAALAEISKVEEKTIGANLDAILSAADAGSVIAKDKAIEILIQLTNRPTFEQIASNHLISKLKTATINQLPMYAERIHNCLSGEFLAAFKTVVFSRLDENMSDSKRRRLKKVLEKLS
ncbi:hypothetical protein [Kiloniella sp. EL199]|uniref:hypothetical protein n=1 Tax=Kiloniella sp. EL199 TaxID=2107581 RepID=UPI000EA1EA1B|nr:hypothetical protein [Kiloniella sp. EL199]